MSLCLFWPQICSRSRSSYGHASVLDIDNSVVVFLQRTSIKSELRKSGKDLIKPAVRTQDFLVGFGETDKSFLIRHPKNSCCSSELWYK